MWLNWMHQFSALSTIPRLREAGASYQTPVLMGGVAAEVSVFFVCVRIACVYYFLSVVSLHDFSVFF